MNRREAIKHTGLILGYTLSASTIAGIMAGCATTENVTWAPKYLTPEQGNTLADVAECILPRTDTPGAKDVMVHEFIDLMMAKFMEAPEQKVITDGLVAVEKESQSAYQKGFSACDFEQQAAILTKMAEAASNDRKAFFPRIKELTIAGYFTSEQVGKEVLKYLPIPGEYKGCIPVTDTEGKNWYM